VEKDANVVGVSGLSHSFTLKISRGSLQLLLDVVEKVEDLIALCGKALDLRGVPVLALVRTGEGDPEVQHALDCLGNVFVFKTLEELEESLARVPALAEAGEKP